MRKTLCLFSCLLLGIIMTACGREEESQTQTDSAAVSERVETESSEQPENIASDKSDDIDKQIQITTQEGNVIVFRLNDSPAADSLYNQLPLSVEINDYGEDEKIFYPPEKLNSNDTPMAEGPAGTLSYFDPWGNVAVFTGECGGASGLYELGEAVLGIRYIAELAGEIQIEAARTMVYENTEVEKKTEPQIKPSDGFEIASEEAMNDSLQKPVMEQTNETNSEDNTVTKMNVQVGNITFLATLENNTAVNEFVQMMQKAPIVLNMSDYSGFEKVGTLGTNFTTSNSQTNTQAGDIVLYNGNQIVIFYDSHSWSYTRLGKIDDLSGWAEALGKSDVQVTFSVLE